MGQLFLALLLTSIIVLRIRGYWRRMKSANNMYRFPPISQERDIQINEESQQPNSHQLTYRTADPESRE